MPKSKTFIHTIVHVVCTFLIWSSITYMSEHNIDSWINTGNDVIGVIE